MLKLLNFLTATPSPSTSGRRYYVQPSPGSPRSSLLFSPTTTAAGLDTKKGTKKSRSQMVSTIMREDAKSKKAGKQTK